MPKKTAQPFYENLLDQSRLTEFGDFTPMLKESGNYWVSGLVGSAKALFIAHIFHQTGRPLMVLCPDVDTAENLVDDLVTFAGEERAGYIPDWEVTPYEGRSPHESILGARLDALYQILSGVPKIWVTTVKALMRRLPTPDFMQNAIIRLKKGTTHDLVTLEKRFSEIGYRREKKVEDLNTFAVRGDILDFFTYAQRNPIRVEFWGDTIEDIRIFDVYSQRSIKSVPEVVALPAAEIILRSEHLQTGIKAIEARKNELETAKTRRYHDAFEGKSEISIQDEADRMLDLVDGSPDLILDKFREKIPFEGQEEYLPYFIPQAGSLIDYLPASAYLMIDERMNLLEAANTYWQTIEQQFAKTNAMRRPMPAPERVFIAPQELAQHWKNKLQIDLTILHLRPNMDTIHYHHRLDFKSQASYGGHVAQAADMLRDLIRDGYQVTVFADNRGQMDRLKQMLEDIPY